MDGRDRWDEHYRQLIDQAQREANGLLDRFQQSIDDWLHGMLNWPDENWRRELDRLVEHSRYSGLEIESGSIAAIRELLEARVGRMGPFAARGADREGSSVVQLAMAPGDSTGSDVDVELTAESEGTYVDGVEVAGPGPGTTDSFRAKVQKALEILDPDIARWWKAPSVDALVRSRRAWFWNRVSSHMEGDRPIVVVDDSYTSGQTAQAIISEVTSGWAAHSIGASYKGYRFGRTQNIDKWRRWQKDSAVEAAQLASVLAELYVSGIASVNPAGELVVTIDDIERNGLRWDQLLNVLPYIGTVAVAAIVIKVGGRTIRIPRGLARRFKQLTKKQQDDLIRRAAAADPKDVENVVRRGVDSIVGPGEWKKVSETMPDRARAYQRQITGREHEAYFIGSTGYDGYKDGKLFEVKGRGHLHIFKDPSKHWLQGGKKLAKQARKQLEAAGSVPLEWHVAEEEFVPILDSIFKKEGVHGVTIVFTKPLQ